MVSEARKQSMVWMEADYSEHAHFQWKIKWRLKHLGALGIMGQTAPLTTKKETPASKEELDITALVLLLGNHG